MLVVAGRPVGVASSFSRRRQATQRAFRQLYIMSIGSLQHQPHRDALRLRQQAALDAAFAAVRGVGTGFFPCPTALCAARDVFLETCWV
jgi:hypothetical protein